MKLIRSCLERGWFLLLGEREQPGPKLGPALPFHSRCWFRRLHCSPGKHLSTISLVPSLWLDVDMHRSFAAGCVYPDPIICGIRVQHSSSGQAGWWRWRHSLILCSSLNPWPLVVPGYPQALSVSPSWIKDGNLLSFMGTMGPVCSKLGHLVLPQVTSSEKSFLQGWRSLSPYYALTGISLCLLEMDVGS